MQCSEADRVVLVYGCIIASAPKLLQYVDDLSMVLSRHVSNTLESHCKLGSIPFGKSTDFALAANSVFVR